MVFCFLQPKSILIKCDSSQRGIDLLYHSWFAVIGLAQSADMHFEKEVAYL